MVSVPKEKPPSSQLFVVYAGTSSRRKDLLQFVIPPHADFWQVDGGPEADIPNVKKIMVGKLENANKQVNARLLAHRGTVAIVAADIRTSIPTGQKDVMQSLPKPTDENAPRTVFRNILAAATQQGEDPYYMLFAASGVEINHKRRKSKTARSKTRIQLDASLTEHLASETGYPEYLKQFRELHESAIFKRHDGHSMQVTDVTSGLDLAVLSSMGAVTEIDGVKRDDPAFRDALYRAMLIALVSIEPKILNKIVPDVEKKVSDWPWLHGVVNFAMKQ
nr:Unknown Function [uncultured bacterium]